MSKAALARRAYPVETCAATATSRGGSATATCSALCMQPTLERRRLRGAPADRQRCPGRMRAGAAPRGRTAARPQARPPLRARIEIQNTEPLRPITHADDALHWRG